MGGELVNSAYSPTHEFPNSPIDPSVSVTLWHTQPADGVALEVEFDEHDRLLADHPPVVARIDRDDLRRLVLDDAAVGVLDMDFAAGQEADMGVHAEVRADRRLHVFRPAEPYRVNHPLDARRAGAPHFELYVPDVPPLGAFHRGE